MDREGERLITSQSDSLRPEASYHTPSFFTQHQSVYTSQNHSNVSCHFCWQKNTSIAHVVFDIWGTCSQMFNQDFLDLSEGRKNVAVYRGLAVVYWQHVPNHFTDNVQWTHGRNVLRQGESELWQEYCRCRITQKVLTDNKNNDIPRLFFFYSHLKGSHFQMPVNLPRRIINIHRLALSMSNAFSSPALRKSPRLWSRLTWQPVRSPLATGSISHWHHCVDAYRWSKLA